MKISGILFFGTLVSAIAFPQDNDFEPASTAATRSNSVNSAKKATPRDIKKAKKEATLRVNGMESHTATTISSDGKRKEEPLIAVQEYKTKTKRTLAHFLVKDAAIAYFAMEDVAGKAGVKFKIQDAYMTEKEVGLTSQKNTRSPFTSGRYWALRPKEAESTWLENNAGAFGFCVGPGSNGRWFLTYRPEGCKK